MHLLGIFMISLIFYDLYGGLRNDLCKNPARSLSNCREDAFASTRRLYHPSPSYIFQSDIFKEACELRIMTILIECVTNVKDSCPEYRDVEPLLMTKESFRAFIIGTCVNRYVFEDGKKCIGSNMYDVRTHANQNCLTYELFTNTSGLTWQQYCSRMIIGIQCSVNKTQEFGCSDEFYDFLLHSSYVRLPVECLEHNSSKFKWLDMYTEIPTKLPESQNRKDKEEPNINDDTVSSATCNHMSYFSIIALNLIFTCYQQYRVTTENINFLI